MFQKAIQAAEQATEQDRAQNYEAAMQGYIAAGDWFIHAAKCKCLYRKLFITLKMNIFQMEL